MAKADAPNSTTPASYAPVTTEGVPEEEVALSLNFLDRLVNVEELPEWTSEKDFFSDLIRGLLNVDRIERGRISCSFSVKPPVSNFYKALHGGAVAAISERVATACARTVVADDRELFLGELSMSYLSAAPINVEMVVDASLVRSGRSITVISVEFRPKKTSKLAYTAHATFFNLPAASKL
ncbi:hypothetical protein Dimus_006495 [Dionaea muscipula]